MSGRRPEPVLLLFALIGLVPLLAGAAGLSAFLLQRAGFGLAVWGLLPPLGLLVAVLAFGAVLGKAAGGRGGDRGGGRGSGGDG